MLSDSGFFKWSRKWRERDHEKLQAKTIKKDFDLKVWLIAIIHCKTLWYVI